MTCTLYKFTKHQCLFLKTRGHSKGHGPSNKICYQSPLSAHQSMLPFICATTLPARIDLSSIHKEAGILLLAKPSPPFIDQKTRGSSLFLLCHYLFHIYFISPRKNHPKLRQPPAPKRHGLAFIHFLVFSFYFLVFSLFLLRFSSQKTRTTMLTSSSSSERIVCSPRTKAAHNFSQVSH